MHMSDDEFVVCHGVRCEVHLCELNTKIFSNRNDDFVGFVVFDEFAWHTRNTDIVFKFVLL